MAKAKKPKSRGKKPTKEQLVISVPEDGAVLEIHIKVPGGARLEIPAGYVPTAATNPTEVKSSPKSARSTSKPAASKKGK